MTTEAADGVFIPNNADHWEVDTFDGDSTPSRITINGVEYRVVDPASTVVLDPDDPDDPDDCQRLYSALADSRDIVRDALRSLLPTPPLPEPNGLGAVAKVAQHANRLYYDGRAWHFEGSPSRDVIWRDYTEVATVLSHGVGCTCGAPDCPGGTDD